MGIDIQWPLVLFTLISGVGGGLLVAMGIVQLAVRPAPAAAAELAPGPDERRSGDAGEPDAPSEEPGAHLPLRARVAQAVGRALAMESPQKAQFASAVASLVLLVVGGCFSLLHLASPQNVMAAVFNIFSFSGISIELILLGFCFLAALGWALALKRDAPELTFKVLAVAGIAFGLLLLFFCGHGYVMVSRPAWDTDLLPVAYAGTGLLSGVFAYGVVVAKCDPDPSELLLKVLRLMMLGACLACAAACLCYGAAVLVVAQQDSPAVFWLGLVLCGILAPIAGGLYAYQRLSAAMLRRFAIAGLVVGLIAVLAVRILMWNTSEGYLELFAMAERDRLTGNSLFHWEG